MDRQINNQNETLKGFIADVYHRLFDTGVTEEDVVACASSLLDVGEFQIFQLAYFEWHGEEGDIKLLERCYFSFIINGNMPQWVRHYARNIILREKRGGLKYLSEEYHRYDRFHRGPDPGNSRKITIMGILLFLAISVAFSLLLIYGSLQAAGTL